MNTPITTRDLWIDAKKEPPPLGKPLLLCFGYGKEKHYSAQIFERRVPEYKALTHWFEIIGPEDGASVVERSS